MVETDSAEAEESRSAKESGRRRPSVSGTSRVSAALASGRAPSKVVGTQAPYAACENNNISEIKKAMLIYTHYKCEFVKQCVLVYGVTSS